MTAPDWDFDDIGDLSGRVAVVTGANSGVGFATAARLAAHGAHTVLACRDPLRGRAAADAIVGDCPDASLRVLELDLAEQASVRRAARELARTHERLDVLVNNAGVMGTPFAVTEDGFERQFATNHLGPFAFTGLVLDLLVATQHSRVVTVTSALHHVGRLPRPDPQRLHGRYGRIAAYATTKLANLLFAYELDRRLGGHDTISVAAHPGWTRSELTNNGLGLDGSRAGAWLGALGRRIGQPATVGAAPILYGATASDVRGGDYLGPGGAGLWGPPRHARSSRRSQRPDLARELWQLSEELTGVFYDRAAVRSGPS